MPTLNPYATYLEDRDPVSVIESTPATLAGLICKATPEALMRAPAPGKWSVRDILCHLADTEIAFGFRLRQVLAEPHHVIQPFDQDNWAAPYRELRPEEALDAFTGSRKWNLALIRTVPREAFSKPATHPERGTMTFGTIVETMGGHDLNHLSQIERLVS